MEENNPQPNQVTSPIYEEQSTVNSSLPKSNKLPIFLFLFIGVVVAGITGGAGYWLGTQQAQSDDSQTPIVEASPSSSTEPVFCTMEAKICPDGSSVGRTGPNCEFAECPESSAEWSTFTNGNYSVSYPKDQLIACDSGGPGDLLLWKAPFQCRDGHDDAYLIDVRLVSISPLSVSYTPISSEQIIINGRQATKNIYEFSETDGKLYSVGRATEVIIPLDKDQTGDEVIDITLMGNAPEDVELFQDVLSTFKFTN